MTTSDIKELLLNIVFYTILIALAVTLLKTVGFKFPIRIGIGIKDITYLAGAYWLLQKGSE